MINIRFLIFLFSFTLFTSIETKFPRLPKQSTWGRRIQNLLFPLLTNLIMRFIVPLSLMFQVGQQMNISRMLGLNHAASIILAIVIMDFMVYIQHVLTHKIPILWRLHRMHHSDLEMDASTGVRFHPFELILSYFYKIFFYSFYGMSFEEIFYFEVILNASAMFNHMNIKLPAKVDKYLSYVIVTPNMHLNHHQVDRNYCDSNYGFFLSIWDRIFRTHTEHLEESGVVGISKFRESGDQNFDKLLVQPFKN